MSWGHPVVGVNRGRFPRLPHFAWMPSVLAAINRCLLNLHSVPAACQGLGHRMRMTLWEGPSGQVLCPPPGTTPSEGSLDPTWRMGRVWGITETPHLQRVPCEAAVWATSSLGASAPAQGMACGSPRCSRGRVGSWVREGSRRATSPSADRGGWFTGTPGGGGSDDTHHGRARDTSGCISAARCPLPWERGT